MSRFLADNDLVIQVELFAEEERAVIELMSDRGYAAAETFGRDRYFRRRQ